MKKRSGISVLANLIVLVAPLSGFMLLAIAMGLIGNLCATFITVFGGFGILRILGFDSIGGMGVIIAGLIGMAIVRAAMRCGEQYCNHYIAFRLLALIRDRVFGALRRLTPAKLEGKDRGNLISLITSDIELLEVFYAHTISPAVIWAVYTVIMTLFIGSWHIGLGLIALAAYLSIGLLVPFVTSRMSDDTGLRVRNQAGDLSSFVLESMRGLPEILQYHAGGDRLEEMNQRSDDLSSEEEKQKRLQGRNTAATNAAILLFDLIMLIAAVQLCAGGAIGFQGVLIPTIALMSSFGPSAALAALGVTLQNTIAAGNRVLDILEDEPLVPEVEDGKDVVFGKAEARDVTFYYDDEADAILDDFSVEIPKDAVIGITGRSGSGKSTFLKLLMRFWDVEQGRILISGSDVRSLNTSNLRDMESYVTQETHLFCDSIRSNLRIAKLDATDEEIEEACRKASVHEFILSLPQGYDTPVGELGDTLSGGERQRIGLARAFLHDAPLLLLDEPTSSLDSLNEAVILRSLVEERGERTVVLVSHRASTMRIAQKVYSVEHGRIS